MKLKLIAFSWFFIQGNAFSNTLQLAEKIVELRSEIEVLNNRYNAQKEENSNKLRSIGARSSQIEAQIDQEELKLSQLSEKINQSKKTLKEKNVDESLKIKANDFVKNLENYINQSLPFRINERIKALQEIKKKIDNGMISNEVAVSRLWALFEDELRLTKENAVHRQVIKLENHEKLANVAKLGMVLMYFKTMDGQIGLIENNQFIELKSAKQKEQIVKLIDGLKKQIRHGEYILPLTTNQTRIL